MKYLAAAILMLLAGCAVKPSLVKPHLSRVPDVEKQPDIAVAADRVNTANTAANMQSAETSAKVQSVKKESVRLRADLDTATAEADRLRQQKTATEAELTALWESLKKASERNLFLEMEIAGTEKSLIRESELRAIADAEIDKLQRNARAKDVEVRLMRVSVDVLNHDIVKLEKSVADFAKSSDDNAILLAKKQGSFNTWRKIFFGVIAVLMLSLGANFLQFKRIL